MHSMKPNTAANRLSLENDIKPVLEEAESEEAHSG